QQYHQRFDQQKTETLSGTVQSTQRVRPMRNASRVLAATVRTDDGQTRTVHLGPPQFVERRSSFSIRPGQQMTIKGSKVNLEGEEILMATTVTQDGTELRLRQDDGTPVWESQQRSQERDGQQSSGGRERSFDTVGERSGR